MEKLLNLLALAEHNISLARIIWEQTEPQQMNKAQKIWKKKHLFYIYKFSNLNSENVLRKKPSDLDSWGLSE